MLKNYTKIALVKRFLPFLKEIITCQDQLKFYTKSLSNVDFYKSSFFYKKLSESFTAEIFQFQEIGEGNSKIDNLRYKEYLENEKQSLGQSNCPQ
jgi:hypothetical protein